MANQYRLSEQFFSIQGEGQYAGSPSLWARVFGCNLKCPKFPCDTEYSWNGDYKDDASLVTASQIVDNWVEMLKTKENPAGDLIHPITRNIMHMVITGGEPLLPKYQRMFVEVYRELADRYNKEQPFYATIESNGTQSLSTEFEEFMNQPYGINDPYFDVLFSFSPKLETVSGEKNAINYENIIHIMSEYSVQLKFVCDATAECEEELDYVVNKLSSMCTKSLLTDKLWVMPLGTTRDDQLQIAPIVEKYQAKGYKIATRNHTYIWSDDKGR
jgi:6-pyruvoyltetrahydropterin 2'-reductase